MKMAEKTDGPRWSHEVYLQDSEGGIEEYVHDGSGSLASTSILRS